MPGRRTACHPRLRKKSRAAFGRAGFFPSLAPSAHPRRRAPHPHLRVPHCDFEQNDSGKTAYFSVRYENAKGEPGSWGAVFHAVIP
jgi:hypothetical protein